MKRTTETRPNGSLGVTRTSHITAPLNKKPKLAGEHREGMSRRGAETLKERQKSEKEREKEREAAFMSSLLADLDDDFWTAPPSSSPQASPAKKKGLLGARGSATSSSSQSTSVSVGAIATKIPPTATTITPVKRNKTTITNAKLPAHPSRFKEPQPFASTSTSSSIFPFASSSFTSTSKPISTPAPTSTSTSVSTPTGFDIQAFLQGSEDWDLSDGALSPVKPIVKPVVQSQHVKAVTRTLTRDVPYPSNPCAAVNCGNTEQKGTQKQGSRYLEIEQYTPDPCTRCVVLSVEDVCVDGAESGKGRKRWEKRIRAVARLNNIHNKSDTSSTYDDKKEKEEVEVEVVLCDGWYETDVRVDDVFNVIGHFSPALTSPVTSTPTSAPIIHITFTNHNNLFILHPDVLLTATALSSAAQCPRKPVLSGLVRQSASGVMGSGDDNKASPAMVYGNILHEVLDRCLVADRWGGFAGPDTQKSGGGQGGENDPGDDEKWMDSCIDEAIRGSLGELVRLGLEEEEVRREIRERARGFAVFAKRYLGSAPKDGILNNTRTLGRDAPSKLAITHLLDIEEDIWSPAYGIKGKIDAVVRGIIDDPVPAEQGTLYNSGLTRRNDHHSNRPTRTQRHTPLPLELKTGRVQTGMDHRAQTMLYTLLLSERYHVDVRDGLLFYSRLRDSQDGKLVGEDMVRVPRGWNEIRGLIGLRNTLAGYIWRRIRKSKDAVGGAAADDDIPNRQEDFHIETEQDIEEDFLPPPIDDEWTCKRCYSIETCLLFRKTHPPRALSSQSQSHGPTHNSVHALPPPGRLRQLFDAHTSHLTPARVDFFRKWEALLALEERDMVRFKRELWVLGAREREKKGRCLGGMRVVGLGPGAAAVSVGSLDDVEDDIEGGDEDKWGKEGKIYRFVYTFEKDLDFLGEDGENDNGNVSLQNTHLVKGDPITVSLMSPRQVIALARGYILDFQMAPSPDSSSSSSSVSDSDFSDLEADEDEEAKMVLNFGMRIEDEISSDKRGKERKRHHANQISRGRVVVGVDHSLHSWLDGGANGGTPLGVGLGSHKNQDQRHTQPKSLHTMLSPPQQRAIFRIDKDELFGGMSRVRENLASLFYASGPVSVPHTTANGSNGQVPTMTKMGRGNKKLLELVVDLRPPEFDEFDDGHEVDEDAEKEMMVHSAEARYLKAVAPRDKIPSLEQGHSQRPDPEQPLGQNRCHEEQQALNTAQSLAIRRALSARDYTLILGMPGTGKTCVIAALVRELVFGSGKSGLTSPGERRSKTVLISSYTHSAVDSILRKLVEGGGWDLDLDKNTDAEEGRGEKRLGGIVRLGNVEKIHPEVRKFSPSFSKGKGKDMTAQELEDLYMNASVVATTCLGLDHPLFSRRRFDYCILDEASQITLPTCLGPLRFADVFVLVGDHHQLPPLVKNPLARPPLPSLSGSGSPLTAEALTSTPSLTTSLFLLLSTAHPESVVELTEQYRMNEDIMTISNELVYGGRMQCGLDSGGVMGLNPRPNNEGQDFLCGVHRAAGSVAVQTDQDVERAQGPRVYKQCRGAEAGDECWLERLCDDRTKAIFINTDALPSSRESRVGDLVQNLGEAALVAQFVETLRRKGVHGSRVGVVTLYRQQVKVLEGLLNGVDKVEGNAVEIMTADKSQGRDKDCVVVSLVRSNDAGRIGDLVKDWRRINVSFTRARCKLVIFGSRQTLEREPMLGRFFELMDRKGWVLDLKEGAERAHEHAWTWPNGVDGVMGVVGDPMGKKRRLGDEEDYKKGKTNTGCGRPKENDSVTSSSTWDGGKGSGAETEKAATRPAKRVRLEDKPDALLRGRPVLRDLVGNETCL